MHDRLIVVAVLCLVWVMSAPAAAQPLLLGPDEFGKARVSLPQTMNLRLEKMIGDDNLEPIARFSSSSRYAQIAKPVGRLVLKIRQSNGHTGTSFCTASLIADSYLLTNYHCIPGRDGVVLDAQVEMGFLDYNRRGTVTFAVATQPVEADAHLDFSVVRVQGAPGRRWGTVSLSAQRPARGDSLLIIHHPAARRQMLSRRDCTVAGYDRDTLLHSCDTLGGSSGSPVFTNSYPPKVVALHHAALTEQAANAAKQMGLILPRIARFLDGGGGGGGPLRSTFGESWVPVPGKSYRINKTEVTVGQYRKCVEQGACQRPAENRSSCTWRESGSSSMPMSCANWSEARAFCSAVGGRLPSPQEWRYAATGGRRTRYPWGNETASCSYAVMDDGSGKGCGRGGPSPVCTRTRGNSPEGLCDMAGNLWEWSNERALGKCWDHGGSLWSTPNSDVNVGRTATQTSCKGHDDVGFRCVR